MMIALWGTPLSPHLRKLAPQTLKEGAKTVSRACGDRKRSVNVRETAKKIQKENVVKEKKSTKVEKIKKRLANLGGVNWVRTAAPSEHQTPNRSSPVEFSPRIFRRQVSVVDTSRDYPVARGEGY